MIPYVCVNYGRYSGIDVREIPINVREIPIDVREIPIDGVKPLQYVVVALMIPVRTAYSTLKNRGSKQNNKTGSEK